MQHTTYIDEAGNTGQNLNNDNQQFFVLAAVSLEKQRIPEYLGILNEQFDKYREATEKEIKARNWTNVTRKAAGLQTIIEGIAVAHNDISVCIIEKRFMAAAMVVDQFFDPYYNDFPDNKWIEDKQSKVEAVNYFYNLLDDKVIFDLWSTLTDTDAEKIENILDSILGVTTEPVYRKLLEGARKHLDRLVADYNHQRKDAPYTQKVFRSPSITSFANLGNMIVPFLRAYNSTSDIVFDSVYGFNKGFEHIEKTFTNFASGSDIILPHGEVIYSWKDQITGFSVADSKEEKGLQFAEIVASSLFMLCKRIQAGTDKLTSYDSFLLALMITLLRCDSLNLVVSQAFRKSLARR